MLTVKVWTAEGERQITAPTHGAAFDQADELGAVRLVDAVGEIFRKIGGEWYGVGFVKAQPAPKQTKLL